MSDDAANAASSDDEDFMRHKGKVTKSEG
jgi:hypothetical protein